MKIKDLIKELEKMFNIYGDVEVFHDVDWIYASVGKVEYIPYGQDDEIHRVVIG